MLLAVLFAPASHAADHEALQERARAALADEDADLDVQGRRLAAFADSLRVIDVELASRCLEAAGIAAFRAGAQDSALSRWQRGVNRAREADARPSESSLLNALAIGLTFSGDVEAALRLDITFGLTGTGGSNILKARVLGFFEFFLIFFD